MINTETFESLLNCDQSESERIFLKAISNYFISFSDINNFPHQKGLYFIYRNELLDTPLYIGSAYAKTRTIKKRCMQYLQKGSGGESFRGKIESLNRVDSSTAINEIKENYSIKFIILNKEEREIKQIEQFAIWCFSPKYNFILKHFEFDGLSL